MIPQNTNNENMFSQINVTFIDAVKELKVSMLLQSMQIFSDTLRIIPAGEL